MAGVLFLLVVSALINVLAAKVLMMKHEEMLKYMGMYKAEARRCERLEKQNGELRIKLNRLWASEG